MSIIEMVNMAKNSTVRIQTIENGYTQFIAGDKITNELLLDRVKNYQVDHVEMETDDDGTPILHIYGINYLNYKF